MAISRNNPRVPLSALRGKEIAQGDKKVVETASHSIQLASEGLDRSLPDFKLTRRVIQDPGAKTKIVDLPQSEIDAVDSGAAFESLLKKLIKDNADFISPKKTDFLATLPEADRSNFAFISIGGTRREQFFDEASQLLRKTGLTGDEAKLARRALNFAHRDAYQSSAVDFDMANTGSYWSYGDDKPFVHVFEKMLESLPEKDPKRDAIQAQLDYVFSKKYAPDGGVRENDAEKSLELMAIDKQTRHVVSMTKDSEDDVQTVRYETLQVSVDGEHKDKFVYRDGDKFFFENSGEAVPEAATKDLNATPAGEVTFRRALENEEPRDDFRFDWNGNRMLDVKKHDTGWWGHCDIKATIETILADMKHSTGVSEFNSASGSTTEYSREMQLEALAALLNFGDAYSGFQGGSARFGFTDFAGARYDDRPSKMSLKTNRGTVPLAVKLTSISSKTDFDANADLKKIFAHKLVADDRKSFSDNPDLLRTEQGDTNFIDGSGRKLVGELDGYTFDDKGRPVEAKDHFVINPNVDTGEKVLIGSELTSVSGRKLKRTYFDPATKEISSVNVSFEKDDEGKFVAKEGRSRALGTLSAVELGREMKGGDDVKGKLEILNRAIREGGKISSDSDTGMQVWNGEVHQIYLKTEWRSDDGQWERVSVHVDATFGTDKTGEFLHKLDAEGKIIESVEIKPAVDFFWRDRPRVAPLVSERGRWYVNRAMVERGVVNVQSNEGLMTSLGMLQDMNDLIYLGLKSKKGDEFFTIVHEGKRLVYTDKAEWEADVKKLKGEAVEEPGEPDAGTLDLKKINTPNLDIPDNDPAGINDTITINADAEIESIKI